MFWKTFCVIIFILIIVIVFWWNGIGVHSCYSMPPNENKYGGSFCVKDLYGTYGGRLDHQRDVFQKYNIVYIGTYTSHWIGFDAGSAIDARPWIILSEKWTDVSKNCFVYDSEWLSNKRYQIGMDSNPPSRSLLYTADGQKRYYVNCYKDTSKPNFLESGNFFSATETTKSLQEYGYIIPSAEDGPILLKKQK